MFIYSEMCNYIFIYGEMCRQAVHHCECSTSFQGFHALELKWNNRLDDVFVAARRHYATETRGLYKWTDLCVFIAKPSIFEGMF